MYCNISKCYTDKDTGRGKNARLEGELSFTESCEGKPQQKLVSDQSSKMGETTYIWRKTNYRALCIEGRSGQFG